MRKVSNKLQEVMRSAGISIRDLQAELAKTGTQISIANLFKVVRQGYIPPRTPGIRNKIEEIINKYPRALKAAGVTAAELWSAEKENTSSAAEIALFMEAEMLSKNAMENFKLKSDPFADIKSAREIYLSQGHIGVYEFMRSIVITNGFGAIYGPVGSGKTTIARKFIKELEEDGTYQIGKIMSLSKHKISEKLLLTAILESLTRDGSKGNVEILARKVEKELIAIAENNIKFVLFIDDAESLDPESLIRLKRLTDLRGSDGFSKLLSIILVGQEELKTNIFRKNSVLLRAVACRITAMELPGLTGQDVREYLKKRAISAKTDITKLITDEAVDAMLEKISTKDAAGNIYKMSFPIYIDRAMVKLLNAAAAAGESIITPEIVRVVKMAV